MAHQVSDGWANCETVNTPGELDAGDTLFGQMLSQGQSVFAASGDADFAAARGYQGGRFAYANATDGRR